jgi:hypothetical protein
MFDYQELILGPLEQRNQDSTDQPVHEHVALHKFLDDYLSPELSHPWRCKPTASKARSTLDRLCPSDGLCGSYLNKLSCAITSDWPTIQQLSDDKPVSEE